MDMKAEAQRVMAVALGKMYSSRLQRGGARLHRSLLLSLVLRGAQDVYLGLRAARELGLGLGQPAASAVEENEAAGAEEEAESPAQGIELMDCSAQPVSPVESRAPCMEPAGRLDPAECIESPPCIQAAECIQSPPCIESPQCIQSGECIQSPPCIQLGECIESPPCIQSGECIESPPCIQSGECIETPPCIQSAECGQADVTERCRDLANQQLVPRAYRGKKRRKGSPEPEGLPSKRPRLEEEAEEEGESAHVQAASLGSGPTLKVKEKEQTVSQGQIWRDRVLGELALWVRPIVAY